ncbi:MAG: valine--tRNA ligase [Actinobacteria bacterium]|nr:valine--tRNA ligase [Actinomycetota bacterium]
MFNKIEGKYQPSDFEDEIYQFWSNKNYFHAEVDKNREPFSIVIPPPNVTGYLHVGHALNNTLQDVIIRYKRMKGYNATWIPGTDHAGIATQNVVERYLNENNTGRYQLGREKFVEEVWKWKEKYGSRIISQLKSLGCSCDWDRQRFTFDNDYCEAVTTEFITLYNEGLIYRGNYMINWCPGCRTAISDIEVDHIEKKGYLWEIKYPVADESTGLPSSDEYIKVATTRPETMLGDTAVAVNPLDKRFRHLKGKKVFLPLAQRVIPVIEDDYVDMDFGSGAVKVTPAHDPNDFEMGKRHNLEEVNIFNDDATLNDAAGKYKGLDRYEARRKVLKDLEEMGYLLGRREHVSSVGQCCRCDTVVEPRISLQWFVSMKKLSVPAIEAVKEGRVRIIPGKWEKIYFDWMENIKDWCISRQLWWGHRIPVWYCTGCGHMIVSRDRPIKCPECGCGEIIQDPDVLDTWFSSCLWPFATLGWPGETEELDHFFPTSVLITAHDIIFFWVARMIMMSLHFKNDVPFREVFINPLVNDALGKKMSKSRGNVVDPMGIIGKNGADVLRFTLTSLTTPGRNLLLGSEKIEGTRNFANKIWNASRFVLSNIPGIENDSYMRIDKSSLNLWDRWILSRLNKVIDDVENFLSGYNFSFACRALQDFFWSDFCDWYLESSKVRLYGAAEPGEKNTVRAVLLKVLDSYLKLLHPFMPFVTERIWQSIPHQGESIMMEAYPVCDHDFIDRKAMRQIETIFEVISEIRKIRSELKINPSDRVKACLCFKNDDESRLLSENEEYLFALARVSGLSYTEPPGLKGYIKTTTGKADIYIYIMDVVDLELEKNRITGEMAGLKADIKKSEGKLANPDFMEKAPANVICKEKEKLERRSNIFRTLKEQLDRINSIKN